jgi:hypothetical protein
MGRPPGLERSPMRRQFTCEQMARDAAALIEDVAALQALERATRHPDQVRKLLSLTRLQWSMRSTGTSPPCSETACRHSSG